MNLDKLGIFAMGLLAVALLVPARATQAEASQDEQRPARFEKENASSTTAIASTT